MTYETGTHGFRRLYRASLNTLRGLRAATVSEAALREELILLCIGVPAGLFLAPSVGWYVAMIGVLLLVLAIELLNTGLEILCDHVTPEYHPTIGVVKDVGSAAVFCGLSFAVLVWVGAAVVKFDLMAKARVLLGV